MLSTLRIWFFMLIAFASSGFLSYLFVENVLFRNLPDHTGGTGTIGHMFFGGTGFVITFVVLSILITYFFVWLGVL